MIRIKVNELVKNIKQIKNNNHTNIDDFCITSFAICHLHKNFLKKNPHNFLLCQIKELVPIIGLVDYHEIVINDFDYKLLTRSISISIYKNK